MHSDPGACHELMGKLCRALAKYVNGQIDAGAQAIQWFDSWVGCIDEADYREFVLGHTEALIQSLESKVPVIYFGTDTAKLLNTFGETSADVIGVDWRLPLSRARAVLGEETAVQGNLDPAALFAPREALATQIRGVLREAGPGPGHIFNLGHGIERLTDPDAVAFLVDRVHEWTQEG